MLLSLVLLVTVRGYASNAAVPVPVVELQNAGNPALAHETVISMPTSTPVSQQPGFIKRTLDFTLINPTTLVSSFIYNYIVCPTLLWGYHVGKYGAMAAGVTALVAPRILREDFTDPGHRSLVILAGGAGLAAGLYFGASDIKQLEKTRGLEGLQFVSRGIAVLREQQVEVMRQSQEQATNHTRLLERFAHEQRERAEAHTVQLEQMERDRRTAEEQATREREAQVTRLRELQEQQEAVQNNLAAARGDLLVIEKRIARGNEVIRTNLRVSCASLLSSLATQRASLQTLALQVRQLSVSDQGEHAVQFRESLGEYNRLRSALFEAANTQLFALPSVEESSRELVLQNSFGPLAQPFSVPGQRELERIADDYLRSQKQLDGATGGISLADDDQQAS